MKWLALLLRPFTARSWSARLTAVAALVVAAHAFWQGELGASGLPQSSSTLQGRVVGVMDGDTLEVLDDSAATHRVRLAYIDAPEHDQPYGLRARQHLAGLVFGQQVELVVHGQDKYGRTLADVFRGRDDVGAAQLQAGLAWHYVYYARKQQDGDAYRHYQALEQQARLAQLGLWQDDQAVAPWDFRRKQR